jgi:F-type H+-transporting ATPase subunit b
MSFQITIGDVTVLVPMGTDDTLPSSDEETDAGNADLSGNAETDTAVQGEAEEEGDHHYGVDDQGYITSEDPLLPPTKELLLGGGASLIIIGLLVWKAGPLVTKGLKARTEKIQGELDAAAQAKVDADSEAARIRQALGDIQGERQRLLAEADAQAAALLADGRNRLEVEVADLEAKADADIATAAGRSGDELRNEIARRASAAADRVVAETLDDATQQRLIEDFIQKVGAA